MNGDGRSRPRLQIEPNDHASEATSKATRPTGEAVRLLPAFSQSTPRKPMPRPIHSIRFGFCPRIAAKMPIHSGADATATAVMPEDTVFSARLTMPLPSTSRNTPIIAALPHCARVGAGTPRQRRKAYIRPPAMMKRTPPSRNGGKPPSSAKRMPR